MKSILRVHKNRNFSVVCNEVAKNPNLSAKAKGLMFYLFTLPDDWQIYEMELIKHFTDGRDSIRSAIKELTLAGYIKKHQKRSPDGKFRGYQYHVMESVNQPLLENPISVNPTLLNTNIIDRENISLNRLNRIDYDPILQTITDQTLQESKTEVKH